MKTKLIILLPGLCALTAQAQMYFGTRKEVPDSVFDWGGVRVLHIIDKMTDLYPYAGPEHWKDAEMLERGNGEMTRDDIPVHGVLMVRLTPVK